MRVVGNIPVKVDEIIQETEFVKRFRFSPIDKLPLPAFTGGAHIKTFLHKDDDILERTYSLVSLPTERNFYEIAIRQDDYSTGGSIYWHKEITVGTTLDISFPKNHFPLSYQAKHHVFYAAGIGITPFLTMMKDLQEWQTFELHYAARTAEQCAFYEQLKDEYGDRCHFYFSRGDDPKKMFPTSMVTHRIGTHVYFCGPIKMVQDYRNAAVSYGYPSKAIHFELFSAGKDDQPKNAFTVELVDSNKTIRVSENESLLEALLNAGIDAPHACKIGGCGSCELDVAEGEIHHRDVFLTAEDRKKRNSILTCCSRAKSEKIAIKI
ncbi:PDR/VanB family oxidoreductase [Psychrobacillus soli]|uniref:Oxidoreductase n=1 Tax=Psychrobacillus soli TaxID=1543965 RepID=A0A544TFC3_9BACI|nr:PDR/VanB family oxidoreductase [Psychrobacillus soli]TQR16150.1 oxidoreductase [Psychrobacillus soli]